MRRNRIFSGVLADFEFVDGTSCNWHVPCCKSSADTGTAVAGKVLTVQARGRVFEGEEDPNTGDRWAGRHLHRHIESPAYPRPRFQESVSFGRLDRPGARTRFRAVSARERGVRVTRVAELSSVVAVPVHSSSQKTKYARSTKPGEQWGSSRSLPVLSGRGSQKVERSAGSAAFSIFFRRLRG